MTKIKGISSVLGSLPEKGQPEGIRTVPTVRRESHSQGSERRCDRTRRRSHFKLHRTHEGCLRKWRENSLPDKTAVLRKHLVGPVCHERQSAGWCLEWGRFSRESHVTLFNRVNGSPPRSSVKWISLSGVEMAPL